MKLFMVVVTSAICTLIILWAFTACSIDKQDARLKILEAAKTAAQQPQERHYFVVCDSAVVAGRVSK